MATITEEYLQSKGLVKIEETCPYSYAWSKRKESWKALRLQHGNFIGEKESISGYFGLYIGNKYWRCITTQEEFELVEKLLVNY